GGGWEWSGSLPFVLRVSDCACGRNRRQCLAQKLAEPLAQRAEPVGVDVVDAPGALGPVRHQARLLQHLEMLRYRRAADRKSARDRADRLGSELEPLEYPAAGRIGQRRQCRTVSHDLL